MFISVPIKFLLFSYPIITKSITLYEYFATIKIIILLYHTYMDIYVTKRLIKMNYPILSEQVITSQLYQEFYKYLKIKRGGIIAFK